MLKNKKLVITVLMPVYNGERYLREAIGSILSQTFFEFEFLIFDDGSKDSSWKIIESYRDERIIARRNENNSGISKILNQGLSLARGKYIARMDADDISLPERLQKQFDFMEKNQDISLAGSWIEYFGDCESRVWECCVEPETIEYGLYFGNQLAHSSIFFRKKDVVESGGYDERYLFAQDYDLYARLVGKKKLACIPEVLLRYRVHKEAISSGVRKKEQFENAQKINFEFLKKIQDLSEKKHKIFFGYIHHKKSFFGLCLSLLINRKVYKKILEKYGPQSKTILFSSYKKRIKHLVKEFCRSI